MSNDDDLRLQWGSVKGCHMEHNAAAYAKLKEWSTLGSSFSAMAQRDTPEQKAIICDMIDLFDGIIQNDWDGEIYTKDQAKAYIMNYGKK